MFLRSEKRNGIALLLLRGAREVLIPFAGAAIFFAALQALADLQVAGVDDGTTDRAIEELIRTIRFVAVAPIKPRPLFALIAVIATSLLGLAMPSLLFLTPNFRRAGAVISRVYTVLTFLAAATFFGGTYNRRVDDLVVRLNRDLDEIRTAYRQYQTNTVAAAAQIVADTAIRTGAAAPEQERVRAALVDIHIAYGDLQRAEARLHELRKRGVTAPDRVSHAREMIERATPARQVRRPESRVAADPAPQPHWSKRDAARHNERLRRAVNFATSPGMRDVLQTAAEGTFEKAASPAADPSGFGEGQTYLGETSGSTDANGDAMFAFAGPALTVGHVVTATATAADRTSEFSEPETAGAAPVISFSHATYTVGEAGVSVSVVIPVTRSGDLDAISTVDYATSNNTATAGSDYTTATGTLTFAAGDDTQFFGVTVTNDMTDEPDEIVNLTLSNPTAATLTEPFTAQLTITDDDRETITIDDDAENEGTTLTFTVRLSNASASDITVDYTTADDTATAGSDYTAQMNHATIPAGSLTTTISILTSADGTTEPDETFFVNLTDATSPTSIMDNQGVGTISNDDAQPTVSIDDDAENEGDTLTFTLTLSNLSASDVTVNYTTADNTANAGTDYTAQTNVATIAAGNLSTTINVPTADDAGDEPDETFFLNLTAAANATITDNQGLGTITDNDAPMADLTITKTAAAPTFTLGDQVTFTITVQNLGPAPATLLTVTDVLPAGTTLVSATGPDATCNGTTTISCTIPTLANGASTTITLIVTANTAAPIANTASVAAASPADPTPLNNAATATVSPTGIDEVPTVTEWGLLLLVFALGVIAMWRA